MSLVRRRRTIGPRRAWWVPAADARNSWEQPAIGADLPWPDSDAPTGRAPASPPPSTPHRRTPAGDARPPVVPLRPVAGAGGRAGPRPAADPVDVDATASATPSDPGAPAGLGSSGTPGTPGTPGSPAGPSAPDNPAGRRGGAERSSPDPRDTVDTPAHPATSAGRLAPVAATPLARSIPPRTPPAGVTGASAAGIDPWQPVPLHPGAQGTWCTPATARTGGGAEARAGRVPSLRAHDDGPGSERPLADALRGWRALALAPFEEPGVERAPTLTPGGRARRREVTDAATQRREALAVVARGVTRGSESGDRQGFLAEVRRRLGSSTGRAGLDAGDPDDPDDLDDLDDLDEPDVIDDPALTTGSPDGHGHGHSSHGGVDPGRGRDALDGGDHVVRPAPPGGVGHPRPLRRSIGTARPGPQPGVVAPLGCLAPEPLSGARPDDPSPRPDPAQLVGGFVQAVEHAGGICHRVVGDLPDSLLDVLVAELDAWEVVVSGDEEVREVAERLASRGVDVARATPERALAAGMGVTSAAAAVATTGALVLDSRRDRGRLAALVPPVHLCVVPVERLVPTPSAVLRPLGRAPVRLPSSLMLLTGPSRDDDVERLLTVGAVGPTALHVVLLERSGRA